MSSSSESVPVPQSDNICLVAHKLSPSQIKNLQAKLCLGSEIIHGGVTLARYTEGVRSKEWMRADLGVNVDKLPPTLRASPGQVEYMKPLFDGTWAPEIVFGRIQGLPHRNGKTGKATANMLLKDTADDEVKIVSIEKIEIVTDELWKAAGVPFENAAIMRQVRAVLEAYNENQTLTDAQLQHLMQTLDKSVLRDEVIRNLIQSPHNPAYLEVLMLVCGEKLRQDHKSTIFPAYVYSFEAQDPHFYHGLQEHHNPMRVVCTVTEKLGVTMGASWELDAQDGKLTGARVLADIAQVVSGLAELQAYLGGLNNNCTVLSFRARVEASKDACIFKRWQDTLLAIPTHGRVWKLVGHKFCSLLFNGTRLVSLEKQHLMEQTNIPYQRDLITFARSAAPLIKRFVPDADPHKVMLINMLRLWTTCYNGDNAAQLMDLEDAVMKGGNAKKQQQQQKPTPKKSQDDEDGEDWRDTLFDPLDVQAVCPNAVPYLQVQFFANDFGVTDKAEIAQIDPTSIYVLDVPMRARANAPVSADFTEPE
jgi:hypothetical protein